MNKLLSKKELKEYLYQMHLTLAKSLGLTYEQYMKQLTEDIINLYKER